MKRFNLLLVTKESGLREMALKSLSKVFKSNFVFEVPTLEDASTMISKLHLDVLVIDLDADKVDLVALSGRLPHLLIFGLSANPSRVTATIDPMRHQVFEKRDFAGSLLAELKGMKKGQTAAATPIPRKQSQTPANPSDFTDFAKLIGQKTSVN
jgi:hypothetical protein